MKIINNLLKLKLYIILILSLFSSFLRPQNIYAVGTCTASAYQGGAAPYCAVFSNTCDVGETPKVGSSGAGATLQCTCECIKTVDVTPTNPGNPGTPGTPGTPGIGDTGADESKIKGWAENILYAIIVIGFLYALGIAPYIAYLYASANPENIKKGKELLMSVIYGLLLLALSTTIVNIVGSEILQV